MSEEPSTDAAAEEAAPAPAVEAAGAEEAAKEASTEPAATPLLEARALRIDRGGAPVIDGLTFASAATGGECAIVLGAPRALFEACAGIDGTSGGELLIAGEPARDAAKNGRVAAAPAAMKVPDDWTLAELCTWSARLGGLAPAQAKIGAHQALGRLDLRDVGALKLAKLLPHVRALVPLAAALATQAPLVVLEDPTAAAPADVARALARKILTALEGKQWILFAGQISLDSPFALHADEAIVIGGAKVAQGAVAEVAAREGIYAVRVHGEARTFARLVTGQGGVARGDGEELTVDLGDKLRTKDLFDIAEEAHSVIVELRPLSRAFV